MITEVIEKIAIKEGVEKEKLMTLSLIAYLNEKKEEVHGGKARNPQKIQR